MGSDGGRPAQAHGPSTAKGDAATSSSAHDGPGRPSEDRFVRHAGDGSRFTLAHAFRCAFEGVLASLRTQRNFRIHVPFAIAAIVLGILLRIPLWGWASIVICIAAVFALEVLNTAVESVVDLVSPEWDRLAKVAKDCAAGAVLVFAVASLAIALIVFLPPFAALFA